MANVEQQLDRFGLWAAISTGVMAAVSLGMAVTTLPRSGPYCRSGCVGYPYTDVAAFIPRDYLWLYPALALSLLVVVMVECIHDRVPASRRRFSRIGGAFTAAGAATLIIDYAIQLTYIQPALLLGEIEGLSPWSQYNPHGVFIALENVGYGLLSVAYVFVGAAIVGTPSRLWRASGWVFIAGGLLTLALLVFYATLYRARLDYRFEVASIGVTWLVLIAVPVLLTIAFLRSGSVQARPPASSEMSGRSLP